MMQLITKRPEFWDDSWSQRERMWDRAFPLSTDQLETVSKIESRVLAALRSSTARDQGLLAALAVRDRVKDYVFDTAGQKKPTKSTVRRLAAGAQKLVRMECTVRHLAPMIEARLLERIENELSEGWKNLVAVFATNAALMCVATIDPDHRLFQKPEEATVDAFIACAAEFATSHPADGEYGDAVKLIAKLWSVRALPLAPPPHSANKGLQ